VALQSAFQDSLSQLVEAPVDILIARIHESMLEILSSYLTEGQRSVLETSVAAHGNGSES
jgi:hypothetical protein